MTKACEACGRDALVGCGFEISYARPTEGREDVWLAPLCDLCADDGPEGNEALAERIRSRRRAASPESFPDRVLRVAREAGYEPTGVKPVRDGWQICFAHATLSTSARDGSAVWVRNGCPDNVALDILRTYAGPDNQPEAVRARKAAALVDGVYERVGVQPLPPVPLDAVEAAGLQAEVNATIERIQERMANEPYECRIGWWGHFELPSRHRPSVILPTDRDDMVSTIIARQVEQGGVDTEGSRAEAERWCAMLAGCVCEGMRATTRDSAYRHTPTMVWHDDNGHRCVRRGDWSPRGKPLGRP